jgi:polyisoprenoid-binding protein YceI
MKYFIFFIFFICLVACQEQKVGVPAKVETTVGITAIYQLDKTQSITDWTINVAEKKQQFQIPIAGGKLSVLEGVLATGDVELDILGIKTKGADAVALTATLQDTSYFDTKISSVGRFIITKIERKDIAPNLTHLISGELTLRNTTRNIQFPAQIQINEQEIVLQTVAISIPLLEWGILPKEKKVSGLMSFSLKAKKVN